MKLIITIVVLGLVFTKSVLSANLACGASSSYKTINIESPASVPAQCTYTIRAYNSRICQLRVVLDEFKLTPPSTIGGGHPFCRYDIFAVSSGLRLCGINNKQHFYVTSTHAQPVTLSFLLTSRVTNPEFSAAKWKMTITQLECPAGIFGRSILGDDTIETVADQTNDLTVQQKTAAIGDGYYLAPIGCLQYFPDQSGTVESFNLNTNVGPYFSDFSYSICFGRGENNTYVRLTPELFQMGVGTLNSEGFDSDCYAEVNTAGFQEDYLFVPFATLESGRRGTRFCGTSLAKEYVDIKPPGPFVISVVSGVYYRADTDIGFKFNYEIF